MMPRIILKGGDNMADSIANVLMRRDGLTQEQADREVEYARKTLYGMLEEGKDPSGICEELFGLEPDYLLELIYVRR